MIRPLLLDLFCCAGGAARGYYQAGFDIIGCDIEPQPRYPFPFIQADALELLDVLLDGGRTEDVKRLDYRVGWSYPLSAFDAIHASPPCQNYSVTKSLHWDKSATYPRLISRTRERMMHTGKPWVIENVEGAWRDMIEPVTLCGSQFGMRGIHKGKNAYIRRHRLFESNFEIPDAGKHDHSGVSIPVYGHGCERGHPLQGRGFAAFAREMMEMDWGTWHELCESVPPRYSRYVGKHLRAELAGREARIEAEPLAPVIPIPSWQRQAA